MTNHLKEIMAFPIMAAAFSFLLYPLAFATTNEDMKPIYYIHILNNLPDDLPAGSPSLKLHCQSISKDIGEKAMLAGEDYNFDTKTNFLPTALFHCRAEWIKRKAQPFNAFVAGRDEHRCQKYHNSCFWSVREDGIYFSNDSKNWYNAYPW